MKSSTLSYLFLLLGLISCSAPEEKQSEEKVETLLTPDRVIMAYYVAERDYQPEKIPVEKLTHIIYSFTNVIDGEMKFRNEEEAGPKIEALVKQKERNPDLKVMIACGGWGADGFSDMAWTWTGNIQVFQVPEPWPDPKTLRILRH